MVSFTRRAAPVLCEGEGKASKRSDGVTIGKRESGRGGGGREDVLGREVTGFSVTEKKA